MTKRFRPLGVELCAVVAGALLMSAGVAAAQTETHRLDGKNVAFASTTDQTVLEPWGPTPRLSATIKRGKRRRVLKIDAMLTIRDAGAYIPAILPLVSGVPNVVHPFARAIDHCVVGLTACAASGTWYIDIDEAEASNPGSFVGEPIEVNLLVGEIAGGPDSVPWDASLSVLMIKK